MQYVYPAINSLWPRGAVWYYKTGTKDYQLLEGLSLLSLGRVTLPEMFQESNHDMRLYIIDLSLQSHLPRTKELM